MRGDTFQIYENITIENITGKCGSIISLNPWKQFFDLAGSTEKPFGTIRNISFANIKVEANQFGVMNGNPLDVLSNVSFKNIEVTTKNPTLKTKYEGVKLENVMVNGNPLEIKK